MRSVEAINEDIRKTKKGLRNAERKRAQCKLKLAELYKELKKRKIRRKWPLWRQGEKYAC